MGALPINHTKQHASPQAIAYAVDNAVTVADGFEMWVRSSGPAALRQAARPFTGLQVLEVGPGDTLGSAVLLGCAGAHVTCADRFLTQWDPDFHIPFYRALRDRVSDRGAEYVAPIDCLLAANRFTSEVIACQALGAEELWKIGRQFDLVFSNAVLEHVQDIDISAANLAAVSREGAYGFHQVDFRDHRDFSRPLEYLTISAEEYDEIRQRTFCEGGCQWRVSRVSEAFTTAGFTVSASPNMYAEPEYLKDVRPRLHPNFAGIADGDLSVTSALLVVTRGR